MKQTLRLSPIVPLKTYNPLLVQSLTHPFTYVDSLYQILPSLFDTLSSYHTPTPMHTLSSPHPIYPLSNLLTFLAREESSFLSLFTFHLTSKWHFWLLFPFFFKEKQSSTFTKLEFSSKYVWAFDWKNIPNKTSSDIDRFRRLFRNFFE